MERVPWWSANICLMRAYAFAESRSHAPAPDLGCTGRFYRLPSRTAEVVGGPRVRGATGRLDRWLGLDQRLGKLTGTRGPAIGQRAPAHPVGAGTDGL